MGEPLNPFFKGIKIAKPDSRQRHSVCNSHCKLRHAVILWPLTVIGFLIKGVLMGEISLVKPDFKPQIWCIRSLCLFQACLQKEENKSAELPNFISLHISFFFSHSLSSSEVSSSFSSLLSPSPPPPPPPSDPCFQPWGESYYEMAVLPPMVLIQQWDSWFLTIP